MVAFNAVAITFMQYSGFAIAKKIDAQLNFALTAAIFGVVQYQSAIFLIFYLLEA